MASKLTALRPLALAVVFFYASGAYADCVDTVPLSAQERDFYMRANAVLKSFLRPAPSVERIRSDDSVTDPAQLSSCKGDKKVGDFTPEVSRKYIWPDPKGNAADTVITLTIAINVRSFDNRAGNYAGGAYGSPSPGRSAGLKVINVEWKLTDAGRGVQSQRDALRTSLAAVIDRQRIEGLVGRPLPSMAESDVMAKKAGPTQLVTPAPSAPAAVAMPASGAAAALPSPAGTGAAPSTPPPTDAVKDAVDTVQKLRGLFGR